MTLQEGKKGLHQIYLHIMRSRIGPQSLNREKKVQFLVEVKELNVFEEAVRKKKKEKSFILI